MTEITIVIPVYNGMPYLAEAVESLLKQTIQDFKIIIINDGSTDNTKYYLKDLRDKRIKVIHQLNRGQGAARNVGLALCESEFIAMMDADDVSFPPRLETQINFLQSHKDVGMIGSQVVYIDETGRKGISPPLPCEHEIIYSDLMKGRHAICQPTLMCRTAILKQIGGFRISGSGEDLDMWLRMGEATKIANLDKVLLGYRIHSNSVNVRHIYEIRARYAYAIYCAMRRSKGMSESPYNLFLSKWHARSLWQRAVELMDIYATNQYRRALSEILNSHWAYGYFRLVWAAICSPQRSLQRISRSIRRIRK